MKLLLLLMPLLLLPALMAWLTRPYRQSAAQPQKYNRPPAPALPPTLASTASSDTLQSGPELARHTYQDQQQLARDERRRASPAYRRAAQSAYQDMQMLADDMTPAQPRQRLQPKTAIKHRQPGFVHFNTAPRQPLTRVD